MNIHMKENFAIFGLDNVLIAKYVTLHPWNSGILSETDLGE